MKSSYYFLFTISITGQIFASDQTIREKVNENFNDAKRASKQISRDFEDKTCELVNGKMVCKMKKVKHSAEKSADKIQDLAD